MTSPAFMAGVSKRLRDIVCNGLGADGAFGADAQLRSIPASRFIDAFGAPLFSDVSYPPDDLDRAVKIRWRGAVANPLPSNPRDGKSIRVVRFTLDVAYVCARGMSHLMHLIAGETEDESLEVGSRGLSDAERIDAALTWSELYGAEPRTDPPITLIYRAGETTIEERGPIYIASSPYLMQVEKNQGLTYDPVP